MNKIFNKKQKNFIRSNYKNLSVDEIAKKLNRKASEIQYVLYAMGILSKKEYFNQASKDISSFEKANYFFESHGFWIVLFLCGIYAAWFSFLSYLKYNSYAYNDFDLALHAQTLWNLLHGSIHLSILGLPFLGNHAHFIHFLLAPFYWIFPSPIFLLLLQSCILGAGGIPLYFIAKNAGEGKGNLIVIFAYLFYPAIGHMNLYEFHPTALSTFFLLWVCWSFQTKRFVSFWVWSMLAISCQENLPLVIFMFGPFAWFRKMSLKWILSPMFIGGTLFFFLAGWFLPALNNGIVGFESLYAHLGHGPFEILKTIVFRPFYVAEIFFRSRNIDFLIDLFLPVAFLSFIRPLWLIPSIPLFLQHLLSARQTEQTIFYHYTAELIPFILVSAMMGWKAIFSFEWFKKMGTVLVVVFIFLIITVNLSIGLHLQAITKINEWSKNDIDRVKDRWIDQVPEQASVMSTFEFLPRLSKRANLYSFHHLFSGYHTLSKKEFIPPDDIDVLFVDAMDHLTFGVFQNQLGDDRFRKFLIDENLGLKESVDDLMFFERGNESKKNLWKLVPKSVDQVPYVQFKGGLALTKTILPEKEFFTGDIIPIEWRWSAAQALTTDCWIQFNIYKNSSDELSLSVMHALGYHLYPVHEWRENEEFIEFYNLLLPQVLDPDEYSIYFIVIDRKAQTILQPEKKLPDVLINKRGILLGNITVKPK